jgi:polar amino acid transport system substrate-binding protein
MKKKMSLIGSLLIIAVVIFGAAGCQNNQPTPPPTPADPSWTRVQESGVLRVGTSSGYPPYEYYDENYQLTGFDIALINSIGSKLGVRVEIKDFAFDGLGSALQVDQIDSAIAAISVTDERAKQVTFSNVYFVGSDGVLARKGSPITAVTTVQDFANKRVGVERGTIYETWVQQELVDTGLIRSDQMFVYAQAKDAVNDLSLDRLDLVITDLRPATAAQSFFDVVLVGSGHTQQRFAIALKLNANELTAKINDALIQLQNDGTLAELQREYLNLESSEVEPLPTPGPTATLAPSAPTPTFVPTPVGCVDAMKFIADLTLDDGNGTFFPDVQPNQSLQKGWRVQNTGTCTWNSTYSLRFVQGSQMGGQPTAIQGNVAPGAMHDIYVNLTAPSNPGQYRGIWQMFNGRNLAFGESLFVQVEVVGPTKVPTTAVPPTHTPTPTMTVAPPVAPEIYSFTANASSVNAGDVITLSWSFSTQDLASAKLTRINPDGSTTPLNGGADVSTPGSYDDMAVDPGTYTYKLSVSSEFAGTTSQSVAVTVNP